MQFVNRNRRGEPVARLARVHPFGVAPCVLIEARDDGAGARAEFGAEAVGIGFQDGQRRVARTNLVFVNRAGIEAGDEQLP